MRTKSVNALFLVLLITEAVTVALIALTGIQLSAISSLILNQLILLVPALIFLAATGTSPKFIANSRIKPVTPLLCIVYTGLCMPLILVVNMISLLFVENEASQIGYLLQDVPVWLIVLVVGILGPVNEEFLFRGVFYHSYRKTGRVIAAMLMSAFLFGLMHLNFNQMSYAFVVGIMGVLLIEATGNIVCSMIFHACINTYNVIVMVLQKEQLLSTGGDTQAVMNETLQELGLTYRQFLLIGIVIFGIIALATTALAALLLYGMAVLEGHKQTFTGIFGKRQAEFPRGKKERLWSLSLIVAVVLSFTYMIVELMLTTK
jgi:membrane protease YdiL (CAAX protease family)